MTGSNLLDIRGGAERMPGRRGKLSKVDFEQLPMTFAEFIHLTEPTIELTAIDNLTYYKDLLLDRFEKYLITGADLNKIKISCLYGIAGAILNVSGKEQALIQNLISGIIP